MDIGPDSICLSMLDSCAGEDEIMYPIVDDTPSVTSELEASHEPVCVVTPEWYG
jgi:hypothetical protein